MASWLRTEDMHYTKMIYFNVKKCSAFNTARWNYLAMALKSQWCHNSDAIPVFFNVIFRPTRDMEISRHAFYVILSFILYHKLSGMLQKQCDYVRLQDGQIW